MKFSLSRPIGLLILSMSAVIGSEQVIDFVALQETAGDPVPARWKDPDSGASIFNLAFRPEGAVKGENYLPGSLDMPLGPGLTQATISLKFVPHRNGVAAITLTSLDGKQRLRIHYDKSGISLSWRDRRVEEAAVKFRTLSAFSTGDPVVLDVLVDYAGDQITVTEGEITDVIQANDNGTPDIHVPELEKLIVTVEGESVLQELKITEK